ncbi:MAG: Metallo-beta-lactamase L1 precursor [Candidatus Heimdallarchaeota archaeon AB_125]|nr:MAG: Metallo-beta-lactamase L1 precursor [Candidatus Heimdallarchaeota archaeon AB_125]
MDNIIKIRLGYTNTYLLRVSDGYVLIDVGSKRKTKKFLRILDDYNISPDKIKYIIVTHAHFDHVGCLAEIKEITGAKVVAHKNAAKYLKQGKNAYVGLKINWFNSIIRKILERIQAFKPISPDIVVDEIYFFDEYGTDLKLIYTPGHTLCSISVIDEDGNAFVGDTAMGFPIRLFSRSPRIAADFKLVIPSWKRIVDEGAKTVYMAHGRPFNISKIRRKVEKKKRKKK